MLRTLRICSWAMITLNVGMTVFMNLRAMDSVYHPGIFLPFALLPYLLLAFTLHRAHARIALFVTLSGTLATLAVGFWSYFDGLFVRFTTLNAPLFIEVPLMQLVPALVAWVIARRFRAERITNEKPAA